MATVLLVEDDVTLAETVKYNLEREGYTVLHAADGVVALEMARREHPGHSRARHHVATSRRLLGVPYAPQRELSAGYHAHRPSR